MHSCTSRGNSDAIHVLPDLVALPLSSAATGAAIVGSMKRMLALMLALGALPLMAETLVIDDQVQLAPVTRELPKRGTTMSAVEAQFGAPKARHEAVGKPPITRWDYEGFSVYFEYQHVVHAVSVGG